ncbi:MAG: PleD family two-component system response regulator [Leptospirillia bacterium]
MKILVADDSRHIVEAIRIRLEHMGWEVLVAYDGQTALEVAKTQAPDLAVIDIYMPGYSGHMVLERLRQDSATKDLPVIFLTAHATRPNRVHALNNGVMAVLPKPCEPELLISTIQTAIEHINTANLPQLITLT